MLFFTLVTSYFCNRAGTLFSLLKPEKQSAQDPLWYIEYNNKLFEQLAQIRLSFINVELRLLFTEF